VRTGEGGALEDGEEGKGRVSNDKVVNGQGGVGEMGGRREMGHNDWGERETRRGR